MAGPLVEEFFCGFPKYLRGFEMQIHAFYNDPDIAKTPVSSITVVLMNCKMYGKLNQSRELIIFNMSRAVIQLYYLCAIIM